MDICIVPCWRRPEFLAACLGRISLCDEVKRGEILIWVAIDNHRSEPPDPGIREVLGWFEGKLNLRVVEREAHRFAGNSFNILSAYKEAVESLIPNPQSLIFMVEEDVMVGLDFFRWHRKVHEDGPDRIGTLPSGARLFCAVGSKLIRPNAKRVKLEAMKEGAASGAPTSTAAYFTSALDYASIGVSFRPERLALVLKHFEAGYCDDVQGYIERVFGRARFRDEHCEQDGLILRVMGEAHGVAAWPYVPRCFHAGFYGVHRRTAWDVPGDLRARCERLYKLLAGPAKRLIDLAGSHADVWPCDLGAKEYTEIVCVEHLD